MSSNSAPDVAHEAFPAPTRTASALIDGFTTDAMMINFTDKLLFTICQNGRLAHWVCFPFYKYINVYMYFLLNMQTASQVHVPLDSHTLDHPSIPRANATYDNNTDENTDMMPMTHITATTILGGTIPELDTMGQLCATQIASAVLTKNPEERRTVVVGLGLQRATTSRNEYFDLVELAMKCLE